MPKESLRGLTEPMYYVLLSLQDPLCGIEIMSRVREISGGRIVIGPGTLYTMLAKFEENGLIRPADGEDVGKRKSYKITPSGIRILKDEYELLARRVEDGKKIMEVLK